MQLDRRRFMSALAAAPILAAPAAALVSGAARAADTAELLTRPLRDLDLPIIGIGTARRYADPADTAALAPLRDTIRRFAEMGGRVIDTAPSYGRAEDVIGQLVEELGVRDRLFLATKVGASTREEGAAQIDDFLARTADARAALMDEPWGRACGPGRQVLPGEDAMDGFYYSCLDRLIPSGRS
jgi:putative N-acetylmannosamine-6-phosphate epimerase